MEPGRELQRYRSSGRTTVRFLLLVLAAMLGGVLIAWPYQRLVGWMPLIYLSGLAYMALAVLIGVVVEHVIECGHNRNRVLSFLAALLIAGTTVAASHVWAYVGAVDVEQVSFRQYVDARVATGWAVSRMGVNALKTDGILVWSVWAVEALGLLWFAGASAWKATLYCEACRQWVDQRTRLERPMPDRHGAEQVARATTVKELWLPPAGVVSSQAIDFLVYSDECCLTCDGPAYLTVASRAHRVSFSGQLTVKTTVLHRRVALDRAVVDAACGPARRRSA